MNPAAWLLLVALGAVMVRLAWRGEGFVHRVAQSIWCRIASLSDYQKSAIRHASLVAITDSAEPSLLERFVRRVMPSLSGWFSPFPTDKGGFHDYLRLYDVLLAAYRERREVHLLEVGVNKGGSLALWREYFEADATIVGIDVNRGVQTFPRDGGIKVVIADSRDADAVARALRGLTFDVIVDDGLHHPDAQRRTYDALRPFLKDDGVYIIEDVYAFDPAAFQRHGDTVRQYPEQSGQRLVVLRPPACVAGEPPGALAGT